MRLAPCAPLLGFTACALIACSGRVVSPAPDASASDSSSQPDVATPDAPLQASADAPIEAPPDGAPDAVVGIDAGTYWDANADAMDSATLPDGACTPPVSYGRCGDVISDPDAAIPSPTWDAATRKLTFRLTVGSWIVVSGTATATLTGADGGTRMATLPVVVQGDNLVLDLTSTLADPSVQQVTITQLVLTDACSSPVEVATGGSGGTYFNISVQRTPPYLTSSGCQVWA